MQVRLGIPTSFRRFTDAARHLGAPILISANALRRREGAGFTSPPKDLFSGVPVALDSAGFVAMFRYGGFPWTVAEYVDLARSYPWDWWASMDYCCEPQIAQNRAEVRHRQDETARMLGECRARSADAGISPPMPVLQGWTASDYQRSADQTAEVIGDLPPLVGLGSVCRRNVAGNDGLLRILDTLDAYLPPHVRLHMFGVKGSAVPKLSRHPRVHSVDSMAWDFAARMEDGPSTMDKRIKHMRQWYARQVACLPQKANGRGPAKDPGAKLRKAAERDRMRAAGMVQLPPSWVPVDVRAAIEARRQTGETFTEALARIVAGAVTTEIAADMAAS